MKLRFDPAQPHQQAALEAVTSLVGGTIGRRARGPLVANPALDGVVLRRNLRAAQERAGLPVSERFDGRVDVEMETGTGKTYTYLRAVHELVERGLRLFVVVVPNVAVRAGVLQAFEQTREHFTALYGARRMDCFAWSSASPDRLREAAEASHPQLVVLNIDAFRSRDVNVIHRRDERSPGGLAPVELLAACRPIVLLDEPQNLESELSQAALESLRPALTIGWSATPRGGHPLLHRLGPVEAWEQRLVKQIEVHSITRAGGEPYARLLETGADARGPWCRLELDCGDPPRRTARKLRAGARLAERGVPGWRDVTLTQLDPEGARFSDGVRVAVGGSRGPSPEEGKRAMVEAAVRTQVRKEREARRRGSGPLAMLSLIFIDRVARYTDGSLVTWIEQAWEQQRAAHPELELPPGPSVHAGFFAQQRGRPRDSRRLGKAERVALQAIVDDKLALLDPSNPLRFVVSHSALREGWDNPNVFTLCAINDAQGAVRRRQEIGRGLRLPVRADGTRLRDEALNVLTVIASEGYEDFARGLQAELASPAPRAWVRNARERQRVQLRPGWRDDADLARLWACVSRRLSWTLELDDSEVLEAAREALATMPPIRTGARREQVARLDGAGRVLAARELDAGPGGTTSVGSEPTEGEPFTAPGVPDLLTPLQARCGLGRRTLAHALRASGRLDEAAAAPDAFLEQGGAALVAALAPLLARGVRYSAGSPEPLEQLQSLEVEHDARRLTPLPHGAVDAAILRPAERRWLGSFDGRCLLPLGLSLPSPLGPLPLRWAWLGPEPTVRADASGPARLALEQACRALGAVLD